MEICRQLEDARVDDYVIFEGIRDDKRLVDEWLEQFQDGEERVRLQKQSYLFMLRKLMAQYKYLQSHVDITTLKQATGELRNRQMEAVYRAKDIFCFIESCT